MPFTSAFTPGKMYHIQNRTKVQLCRPFLTKHQIWKKQTDGDKIKISLLYYIPISSIWLIWFWMIHAFLSAMFISAERNSNLSKIGLTLPDKKVFQMLFRNGAIIWLRSWILAINNFRHLCFRIGHFCLVLLIKVML